MADDSKTELGGNPSTAHPPLNQMSDQQRGDLADHIFNATRGHENPQNTDEQIEGAMSALDDVGLLGAVLSIEDVDTIPELVQDLKNNTLDPESEIALTLNSAIEQNNQANQAVYETPDFTDTLHDPVDRDKVAALVKEQEEAKAREREQAGVER